MFGLRRLANAVRAGLWLLRHDGLRGQLETLNSRTLELNTRMNKLVTQFDSLTQIVGPVGSLTEAVKEIESRNSALYHEEGLRWAALGMRLEALTKDLQGDATVNKQWLSAIGNAVQSTHDRAVDALRRADTIDRFLRSRSRVFGHEMFLDPSDSIVSPCLLRDGYFEPYETALIATQIREGDVVLDIGANIGYYTLIFARLVGETGRVYAFEPDPMNFELLKKNVRANGYQNVVFVKRAVSDQKGPLRLYLCPDNKGDHRIYESEDQRETVSIESITLDEHFSEFQGSIDFIKMDIQGSEGRALRGMRNLLARQRDVKIITEFWPAGLRRCGVEARDYLDDLATLGFQLFRIDEDEETTEPTSIEELLTQFPVDREQFSNLYCARSA